MFGCNCFAQYPLTLSPKHDIVDICAKHFPTRLFEGAVATFYKKMQWKTWIGTHIANLQKKLMQITIVKI